MCEWCLSALVKGYNLFVKLSSLLWSLPSCTWHVPFVHTRLRKLHRWKLTYDNNVATITSSYEAITRLRIIFTSFLLYFRNYIFKQLN